MPNVLFAGTEANWGTYKTAIPAALEELNINARFSRSFSPEDVDYIVYSPLGLVQDFTPFTNLKAVLSLWAGVERITTNPSLRAPLCRMVDSGLKSGMTEYVVAHVLRYHLGLDAHILNPNALWQSDKIPPLAKDRRVGILGLGELGIACATALARLGFGVSGWSRHAKQLENITCFSGPGGLAHILSQSEILVLLLPQTPETDRVLNAKTLHAMPKGACIINPGRGPLIDDEALLAALDQGQIAHATLDVFVKEPLPAEHPYWAHPQVTVTPHIASDTRPETAAKVIAENIRRGESNEAFLYQVNRGLGY